MTRLQPQEGQFPMPLRPFRHLHAVLVLVCLGGVAALPAAPALAQQEGAAAATPEAGIDALVEALALPEMVAVMRQEGLAYGEEIAAGLFGGPGPAEWTAAVAAIYDAGRIEARLREALAERLGPDEIAAILAFFTTEPGRTFVRLELSAREAMLDDAVEELARETAALALAEGTARYRLVERFVAANDLIEANVASAMNANYAYYIGLLDGGGLPPEVTADRLLADVRGQEAAIRRNTTEWIFSYLMLAYQPAGDADLEAYIAFSETGPGRALNRVLFGAFDSVFNDISRSLGLAAARFMGSQEL